MYTYFLNILFFCFFMYPMFSQSKNTITIGAKKSEKMKILLGIINPTEELNKIADLIMQDLQLTGWQQSGFNVTFKEFDTITSTKKIKDLYRQGFSIAVFINDNQKESIEYRIYDTNQAKMISGKRIVKRGPVLAGWAHNCADELWNALTSQEGVFSTKIAYCKEYMKGRASFKDIYIKSPHGFVEELIVQGGKPLAPRWNTDLDNPLLLYSEQTPINIRLMSTNMKKQRKIVSNFDGLNMLPSFSPDGYQVVYCASHEGNSQLYYYKYDPKTKQGTFSRLTHNNGNNISPSLCSNGDIIFCSDFEKRLPQIYYYHADTKKIERLTNGGYCASPSFCEKDGKIAYSKLVNGTLQIFIYDIQMREHQQLTFDIGNKDECSWSPCGNYVAFSYERGKSSRIAVLHLLTNERRFITPKNEYCCYPAWSPHYREFISIIS